MFQSTPLCFFCMDLDRDFKVHITYTIVTLTVLPN